MQERKTAGELSLKAASDSTKYDPWEVGYALTDGMLEQIYDCAKHCDKIYDEEEYCIVCVTAGDPLIKGIKRFKYYGWLWLPKPRPQQVVFLWNKTKQQLIKRLWSLPDAKVMATISEMSIVAPRWMQTKAWCDAFFDGVFWEYIRKEHDIKMLSQDEFLEVHREELVKAGCEHFQTFTSEPFDFSKISAYKVEDSGDSDFK